MNSSDQSSDAPDEKTSVTDNFFRNIIDNVPGAVMRYRVKADGTDDLLYISDAAAKLWGVSKVTAMKDVQTLWRPVLSQR